MLKRLFLTKVDDTFTSVIVLLRRTELTVMFNMPHFQKYQLRPGDAGQYCLSNISICSLVILYASCASSQIYWANWQASIQQAKFSCREENVFDQNKKRFFAYCQGKMCLPNMNCLKNLVVGKQATKDTLLKLFHFGQTMLISIVRPLTMVIIENFYKKL